MTEETDLKARKLLEDLEAKTKKSAEDLATVVLEDTDEKEEQQTPAAKEEFDPLDDLRSQVSVLERLGAKIQKAQNKWTAPGIKQFYAAIELMRGDIMAIERKLAFNEGWIAERHDIIQELLQELPKARVDSSDHEQPDEAQGMNSEDEADGRDTYATVVGRRRRRQLRQPSQPVKRSVLLTYPTSDQTSSEDTRKHVKKGLAGESRTLQIHRISKIKNGGVAIELSSDVQASKVRAILQQVQRFEVTVPRVRLPRLLVYDIPSDATEEMILEEMYRKNLAGKGFAQVEFDRSTKLLYRSGPKGGTRCHWVFETSREIRSIMLREGRLFYDMESVRVVPFQLATRCFKCQRFGHTSTHCTADKDTCGHCGAEGHKHKDCPKAEDDPVCVNCVRARHSGAKTKHSVHDKGCPALQFEKERMYNKNAYE